jgi:phosphatidate phosphatase
VKSETILKSLTKAISSFYFFAQRYLIDLFLLNILVISIKLLTLAPRPHFFDTCKPDKLFNCTFGSFVSDFKCLNENDDEVEDASWSFLSGHAAVFFYSCVFVIWYLQKRFNIQSHFTRTLLHTSMISLAYFGSISRVFDNRHHWWDVLAGSILGLLTAWHTIKSFDETEAETEYFAKKSKDEKIFSLSGNTFNP